MRATLIAAGVAAIALALALGGCAVMPEPLTGEEAASLAQGRLDTVAAGQEPVVGSVDLYEAMARALKYNLDLKVEEMQEALRIAELDLSSFAMLPSVVANSGYTGRNKPSASSSYNLVTDVPNFGHSTSQDKRLRSSDIGFSWNILDFGLSYIRARQSADKALIATELRRKIVNRIIEDVRTAYWRTVGAERMMRELRRLEGRTDAALRDARALSQSQVSQITALTYERELVEIRRTLQAFERDLGIAKDQLAALMNLPPGTPYNLSTPERTSRVPPLTGDARGMIWAALTHRPELNEVAYQRRINSHEADAALLELLPGLNLYAEANTDSNSFLLHNNWVGWGAKASWNLLKVFQYPAREAVVGLQDDVLRARELALTMAVMTQVHVSRVRYLQLGKELITARDYLDVQRRLVRQMRAEAAADRISEQTLIREEMNTLVAEVRHDIAFSDVQNAYANLFASMGLDPYADEYDHQLDVATLAAHLRDLWFERGRYNAGAQLTQVSD